MPCPKSRIALLLALCLLGTPGQAANIWSQSDVPTGPAVYAPADALAAPEPRARRPAAAVFPMAPDFNRWAGGPGIGARPSGFPFFSGNGLFSFGAGGPGRGPGGGFAFGLFN